MFGIILKACISAVFITKAIDLKLKNDVEQATYYMIWAVLAAVVFNA